MLKKGILILSALFVLLWCENNEDITQSTLLDLSLLEEAVSQYNSTRSPSQHEGVIITGEVAIGDIEVDGRKHLEFMVNGKNIFRKYEFQYDNLFGLEAVPNDIENARTTFLGDNLIIEDLGKQQTYSFLVNGFKNRVEGTTPVIGIGLGSIIIDTLEDLNSSGGWCLCYCANCVRCNYDCGSATASCSCGRFKNSKTCSDCYNAECGQCPSQE